VKSLLHARSSWGLARNVAVLGALATAVATRAPAATRDDRNGALPAWLTLHPGTLARVDAAPWFDSDEPEAALTQSAASLTRDFGADGTRPSDVAYAPVGVTVRIIRLVNRSVAAVRRPGVAGNLYAPVARLIPEIPAGTRARAGGGFGGAAQLFASLAASGPSRDLPTGTALAVLGTGVAAFDPNASDFVRARVRIESGALRGTTGWMTVAYLGIPSRLRSPGNSLVEDACGCRLALFEETRALAR